mgnify:FL=1|jgi:hypothetical protein
MTKEEKEIWKKISRNVREYLDTNHPNWKKSTQIL